MRFKGNPIPCLLLPRPGVEVNTPPFAAVSGFFAAAAAQAVIKQQYV